MKIWVIGRNYPNKGNKMCGSFELEQAKALAKSGHDVSYITCVFHPLHKVKKWGKADWKDGDVHVYAYSHVYAPQRLNLYMDFYKKVFWDQLLKSVENDAGVPDVIHVHYPTLITVPSSILFYKTKGTKIVVTEHWTKVQNGKLNKHEKRQLSQYSDEANTFICVGASLKRSVVELTGKSENVVVVPNMVPEEFDISKGTHSGFRFVAVGRLVPVKQFDSVISAYSKCFKENESISLTIIGSGSEFSKLKKLTEKLGVEKSIYFTGALSRIDTANVIANSDVLICFSKLETFGVPVIEAWSCGIPAIGTDALGFINLWDRSLGELISWKDEDALCEAMQYTYINKNLYSKEKIRRYAVQNFSESKIAEILTKIYDCK